MRTVGEQPIVTAPPVAKNRKQIERRFCAMQVISKILQLILIASKFLSPSGLQVMYVWVIL